MPLSLDDLVEDGRLKRLFSKDGRDCALQIWVLRLKSNSATENRIVYGRLLPYSHSSNTWHATDDDRFDTVGEDRAQIVRVSLYLKSTAASLLLNHLSNGFTIATISKELEFRLSPKLAARIGETSFGLPVVYSPVVYLLNRDSQERAGPLSPHGGAGAFSASMLQADMSALLRTGSEFNKEVCDLIVERLDTDTGLQFGDRDVTRLGSLGLLVFPTLDDQERELLSIEWNNNDPVLTVKLNPIQLPHYDRFHVRVAASNDGQLIYSNLVNIDRVSGSDIECDFGIPENLKGVIDETEVEIYGSATGEPANALCCRWRSYYFRQINLNVNLGQNSAGRVRFDWLEGVTRSAAASQRVLAALNISQQGSVFSSQVGGREEDPWVPVNCEIRSLFRRVRPPQSDGRFFDRLSDGDGLGRLEFVEWIKDLLTTHQNHQVIVFDPYFEDAGIGLIVPNAGSQGEYIVFTSLPKPEPKKAVRWYEPILRTWRKWVHRHTPPVSLRPRINNLLAGCEQLMPLMRNVRLRVFGLKFGTLHDRYILIADQVGAPTAGYHLSNSIQKANENYPLLITPIPMDVLFKVHDYTKGILTHAFEEPSSADEDAPRVQLLFDSKTNTVTQPVRIEPLDLLDRRLAGDVLAGWSGNSSLRGLNGDALRQMLMSLGLLSEGSLLLDDGPALKGCLAPASGNFTDFIDQWELLGELLANSRAGISLHEIDLSPETAFLGFLTEFVRQSFGQVQSGQVDAPLAHATSKFFQEPLNALLASSNRPQMFFHPVKYAALTWAHFFALQILWRHAPNRLLTVMELQAGTPPEAQQPRTLKESLLSQVASDIALDVKDALSDEQRDGLLRSPNGLLKWFGLNWLKSQLRSPNGTPDMIQYTASWNHRERILVLGWMIEDYATARDGEMIYRQLIDSLLGLLPSTMTAEETNLLVDSMRGHMRGLGWSAPWLYKDILSPLVAEGRIVEEHLCDIWMNDLICLLEQALIEGSQMFNRSREGSVTATGASLFARSGAQQQAHTIKSLRAVLLKAQRHIRQPLASTLNWGKWNSSLVVSMWIFAFTKWAAHSLVRPSGIEEALERLLADARSLALVRPVSEWQSHHGVGLDALARFVDEVGGI